MNLDIKTPNYHDGATSSPSLLVTSPFLIYSIASATHRTSFSTTGSKAIFSSNCGSTAPSPSTSPVWSSQKPHPFTNCGLLSLPYSLRTKNIVVYSSRNNLNPSRKALYLYMIIVKPSNTPPTNLLMSAVPISDKQLVLQTLHVLPKPYSIVVNLISFRYNVYSM